MVAESDRRTGPQAWSSVLLGGTALLCAATVLLILERRRVLAGLASLLAMAGLAAASLSGRIEPGSRAEFGERILDRAFDACVLAPLAWVMRAGSARVAGLSLVAMGISFLASYERARGQSLGYRASEPLVYTVPRAALLSLALLTGAVEGFLWAFAVFTALAAAVRAYNVVVQERLSRRKAGGEGP